MKPKKMRVKRFRLLRMSDDSDAELSKESRAWQRLWEERRRGKQRKGKATK